METERIIIDGWKGHKKKICSKTKLFELYIKGKKSTTDISKLLKCSDETIRKWLRKHKIPVRTRIEGIKLVKNKLSHKGENHPCWKGGIKLSGGYISIHLPTHPLARENYVKLHRLVMEEHLGRYLKSEEIVHHINRIRDDNRIENLRLFKNSSQHIKYHRKNDHRKN